MKRVIRGVVILTIVAMFVPAFAEVIGKTDKEVRTIAEPILDNILEGIRTNDYVKYSGNFDDTIKEAISEEKFLESNRQIQNLFGNYQSREYLGSLIKGQMSVILWKGKFDKSTDDVLIELVVSKRKDKYLVTGLWFK